VEATSTDLISPSSPDASDRSRRRASDHYPYLLYWVRNCAHSGLTTLSQRDMGDATATGPRAYDAELWLQLRKANLATHGLRNMVKVIYVTTVPMALKYLLLDQMRSLRRDGYCVVGASAPGTDSSALDAAGFDHVEIPALTRHVSFIRDIRAICQLYMLFRAERPDIVHSHTPKPTVLSTAAARLAGTPIVVSTIHGFYSNELMRRGRRIFFSILEWLGVILSHHIFFRSIDDLIRARSWPLVREGKLGLLTGGIDLSRFDPSRAVKSEAILRRNQLGIADSDKVIGFVGRLAKEKGVLDLLRSAPQIRQEVRNVHLVFVGPEDTNESFEAISTRLGMATFCHFVGQRDDVENWYSLMDVLVLPSYREGFPRTLMEASALGIPIITTDVRGCRDAVLHRINGLVVEAGNIDQLAHAVTYILQNAEVGRQFAEAGRKHAIERFDQEREFETTKQLYQNLLAHSDTHDH
jgi:glycosyltransferase involved in cell wall biosynthesis